MLNDFFNLNAPFDTYDQQHAFMDAVNQSTPLIANSQFTPPSISATPQFRRIKKKRFDNVSLSKKTIDGLSFTECRFEDCLFINTVFKSCEFHYCHFKNCNFYKCSFESTYIDPNTLVDAVDPKKYANIGLDLFQELARTSALTNQHVFRARAEFLFERWRRFQLRYDREQGKISQGQYYWRLCGRCLLEFTSGYGWRPGRLALSIVGVFIVLTLFNYSCWTTFGLSSATLPKALFFTAGTVATFGQGGFVPTTPFGYLLVSMEGMIGVILFALIASIAFKKAVKS